MRDIFAIAAVRDDKFSAYSSIDLAAHVLAGGCHKHEFRRFGRIQKSVINPFGRRSEGVTDRERDMVFGGHEKMGVIKVLFGSGAILRLQEVVEGFECLLPLQSPGIHPSQRFIKRVWIKTQEMVAAFLTTRDEVCAF